MESQTEETITSTKYEWINKRTTNKRTTNEQEANEQKMNKKQGTTKG